MRKKANRVRTRLRWYEKPAVNIDLWLHGFFFRLGKAVSRRPHVFVLLPLALSVLAILGWGRVQIQSPTVSDLAPAESVPLQGYMLWSRYFNSYGGNLQIVIRHGSRELLAEVRTYVDQWESPLRARGGGGYYASDFCLPANVSASRVITLEGQPRPGRQKCRVFSAPLSGDTTFVSASENVTSRLDVRPGVTVVGEYGVGMKLHNVESTAPGSATSQTFRLLVPFERVRVGDAIHGPRQPIELELEQSINQRSWTHAGPKSEVIASLDRLYGVDIYIVLGFLALFGAVMVYAWLSAARSARGQWRLWFAPMSFVSSTLSILATWGLFFWLGWYPVLATMFSFIVCLGIGMDDAYLLLHLIDHAHGKPSTRLAHGMAHAGPAIVMTSITDAIVFAIGTTSSVPYIRDMCIITCATVIVDAIMQSTFFVALLYLDMVRQHAQTDRLGCVPCMRACCQPGYATRVGDTTSFDLAVEYEPSVGGMSTSSSGVQPETGTMAHNGNSSRGGSISRSSSLYATMTPETAASTITPGIATPTETGFSIHTETQFTESEGPSPRDSLPALDTNDATRKDSRIVDAELRVEHVGASKRNSNPPRARVQGFANIPRWAQTHWIARIHSSRLGTVLATCFVVLAVIVIASATSSFQPGLISPRDQSFPGEAVYEVDLTLTTHFTRQEDMFAIVRFGENQQPSSAVFQQKWNSLFARVVALPASNITVLPGTARNWLQDMAAWAAAEQATPTLPTDTVAFGRLLHRFLDDARFSTYREDMIFAKEYVAGTYERVLEACVFVVPIKQVETTQETFQGANKFFAAVEKARNDVVGASSEWNIHLAAPQWLELDSTSTIFAKIAQDLLVSSLAMFVVFWLFLFDPRVSAALVGVLLFLAFFAVSVVHLAGFAFDSQAMLSLLLSYGSIVDYSAHVAHQYMISVHRKPRQRLEMSLNHIGGILVDAFVTTALSSIICFFLTNSLLGFFVLYSVAVVTAFIFAAVLMPQVLLIINPRAARVIVLRDAEEMDGQVDMALKAYGIDLGQDVTTSVVGL